MIILITGATHTGKTNLAHKLLNKKKAPYYSQDHIKMGLIRSGLTNLTPESSVEELTKVVWPVTREIIKTAIENKQDLIVEGCYIPFNWQTEFDSKYIKEIKYLCICFSDAYINKHFITIKAYENCIEKRAHKDSYTVEMLQKENARVREGCDKNNLKYVLINDTYKKFLDRVDEINW